jgi:hypothetical protein
MTAAIVDNIDAVTIIPGFISASLPLPVIVVCPVKAHTSLYNQKKQAMPAIFI